MKHTLQKEKRRKKSLKIKQVDLFMFQIVVVVIVSLGLGLLSYNICIYSQLILLYMNNKRIKILISMDYILFNQIQLHYSSSFIITSHHITSHHITSHHITSHHITFFVAQHSNRKHKEFTFLHSFSRNRIGIII